MGFLRQLFSRPGPAWSGFAERAAFERFLGLLERGLPAGSPQWRLRDGTASFQSVSGDFGVSIEDPTRVFFESLARAAPQRALGKIERPDAAEGFDMMPRVRGCLAAGLPEARELFVGYVQRLTAFAYRPVALFGMLLEAALFLEDADLVRTTLERGGPNGWQATLLARDGVTRLARRRSTALPSMLELLGTRFPPGPVAGRDASAGGLNTGHVGFRPDWLTFQRVRAQDTLPLIGPVGPVW